MTDDGGSADRLNQAGLSAFAAGDYLSAERFYRRSIDAAPAAGGHWHNLGALLYALGRLSEAQNAFEAALADPRPTTRYNLGMTLLRRGDYGRGWPLFEARRQLPTAILTEADLPMPYWRGESLAGKAILLFAEQGLGDTLQFARFAPLLRDQGARVTLLCPPALTPLLRHSLNDVEVRALEGDLNLGEPDCWAFVGSLPSLFKTTTRDVPSEPYLRAPNPHDKAQGRLRIGLATRGSPSHANDARRSLSEPDARRLRGLPGVEVVSLHREDSGDFIQTADRVAGLDLVISVDSAVGHLAGAIGVPTWLLTPGFNGDWRWIEGREDTPWYLGHRLFQGDVSGDWDAALTRVETAVAAMRRDDR